jgi:hypothetical protein
MGLGLPHRQDKCALQPLSGLKLAHPGGVAVLDLYEGMPHVFQIRLEPADAPETKAALAKMASFPRTHVGERVQFLAEYSRMRWQRKAKEPRPGARKICRGGI